MIHHIRNFIPFGIKYLLKDKPYVFKLTSDGCELCWQGKQLVWSKQRCLLHHLHLPGKINDALLCFIDKEQYLAVLYNSGLSLFTISGDSILVPIQFQISKMFPLHRSLLLFRSSQSSLIYQQYHDFPVLFTLFHPLEEIRPVAYYNMSFSPLPKHTAITSPNLRKKKHHDSFKNDVMEKKIFYITDLNFQPLQVSDERAYLLASSGNATSIWRFVEPNGNRDLLFASPHLTRSPSVFSPPVSRKLMDSQGMSAKKELKLVLESVPPDLYMEMIFDFNDGNGNAEFIDISDGKKKIILFLQNNKLKGLDVTYIDSNKTLFLFENVKSVCKFHELMFFVVYTDNTVVLHEEDRVIVHLPFKNVKSIQKFGRQYACSFEDGSYSLFYFDLSFKPVIYSILNSAHLSLSPESYATLVLSLNDELSDYETFIPSFIELLTSLIDESEIIKFIYTTHLLFEELRIQNGKEKELKLLASILIQISQFANLPQYLLYYSLYTNSFDEKIEDSQIEIQYTDVLNITNWICDSIQGNTIEEFPKLYPYSAKISNIFTCFKKIKDIRDIVVNTVRSKFTKKELKLIKPGIYTILKQAFQITAKSPPQDWPFGAYRLIGRNDIAELYEYITNKKLKNIVEYKQSDLRFLEVERLLQSHIPLTVDVERPNGIDDIKFQSMLIDKLKILLAKQWSLSVGRGLFNLRSFIPVSSQTIKKLELNNYGYTENAVELIPEEEFLSQRQLEWPEFHNGVADGLTVNSADCSWIIDTITKEITPYSSGEIFGFGLNGYLKKISKIDIYQIIPPSQTHDNGYIDINIISLILGLSISYRKTHDDVISNILTSYISKLLHFSVEDDDVPLLIQAAAICGIGFLYESSSNRHITEEFLNSLEGSALSELPVHQFSLGVSIGLINLGLGDKSSVLRDNRERICKLFKESKTINEYENEKTITFGNSNSFTISPPAIMALILGYLRTGDYRVKTALSLPNNASYINQMLPDIILLRTLGGLLVDEKQDSVFNFVVPDGLNQETLASVVTGLSIACGIKYAGTLNKKAFEKVHAIAKCLCLLEKTPFDFSRCNLLHREQYLSIVILSCSLIIAGTCDVDFLRFVRYVRRRPISVNLTNCIYGFHMILSMAIGVINLGKGRYTIGTNNSQMAALLIALYPRLSLHPNDNIYYLQPLRHLISLAAIPRVLEVRDVDTQKSINLHFAHVYLNNGTELILNTPHVLPPYNTIKSISIQDPNYYEINLEPFPYTDENIPPIIWIKKLPEKEKQEELDIEYLRMTLKMNEKLDKNKIERNEDYYVKKYKFEVECDKIGNIIIEFLRCRSVKGRIKLMKEYPNIKNFLLFYGISPSALIEEIEYFDDEAIAFLIPYLSEDEIQLIVK